MATVILVRHGDTPWTEENRIQGWADVPLSATGRRQADRAAARIDDGWDVTRIVSSDLRRADETAARIADRTDSAVTHSPSLRERDFGEAEGVRDDQWDGSIRDTPPGAEDWLEMADRVRGGWREFMDELEENEVVVVVAHYGSLLAILAEIRGVPFFDVTEDFDPGGITVVDVDGGDASVSELNASPARE